MRLRVLVLALLLLALYGATPYLYVRGVCLCLLVCVCACVAFVRVCGFVGNHLAAATSRALSQPASPQEASSGATVRCRTESLCPVG
jgi:hypothetical protein